MKAGDSMGKDNYEPKFKNIMSCLRCGGKISTNKKEEYISKKPEKKTPDKNSKYNEYYYICLNHKKCTGKSSCTISKKIDDEILKQFEQFYKKYIPSFINIQQDSEVIRNFHEKKLLELYEQKVQFYNEVNEHFRKANYPFEPILGYISKEAKDNDDIKITEIEEDIELYTWVVRFNDTKKHCDESDDFKGPDLIRFTRIELNLKDAYGIIKFLNPKNSDLYVKIIFGWDNKKRK